MVMSVMEKKQSGGYAPGVPERKDQRLVVLVNRATLKALRERAKREDRSVGWVVREAIQAYLDKR